MIATLVALAGCGGDDEETSAAGGGGEPGEGGTLVWSLDREPATLDPLRAEERGEQLVTRQVHEPLVEELAGPFGDVARQPGLALSVRPSDDRTIWRLRLRRGIRFQDGTPFNASAVLANAERWRSLGGLLPDFLVDAPRPDLVRFILAGPDSAFDRRLTSPQLGIVSPTALRRDEAGGLMELGIGSGTGPFELRERERGRLLLAVNTDWWGAGRGLGPAIDQLEFIVVTKDRQRLDQLSAGETQAAEALGPALARRAGRDPLLSVLPEGGAVHLGLERSVRGIDSAREIPSLQAVWLTSVGP